jgi:hypothetical protein
MSLDTLFSCHEQVRFSLYRPKLAVPHSCFFRGLCHDYDVLDHEEFISLHRWVKQPWFWSKCNAKDRSRPLEKIKNMFPYDMEFGLTKQADQLGTCKKNSSKVTVLHGAYTRKNLTSCSKSANKPPTSCVPTTCPKLSTSLEQAVNIL